MLKKTGEKIKVDKGDGTLVDQDIYEKVVKTKILVNKSVLIRRKAELEEELAEVNLHLAQIDNDEKNDI